MKNFKKDFPIFEMYPNLVYLDSAATSQKPIQVIKAVSEWYTKYNCNPHRGLYDLSQQATEKYEQVREKLARFVGAKDKDEIVFCGNASEGMNLVAQGWGKKYLKKGDVVAISEMEHHSNIVPWLKLKEERGIKIFWLPINKKYELDYQKMAVIPNIKLVSVSGASNVLGTINPVAEIKQFLDKKKIRAKLLVDGAQLVPHVPVDVKKMGCDFLVWSGHKMLGPSGVGVVWAKKERWEEMDPMMVGSHMISIVTKERAEWAQIPDKFEMGTGRLEAVYGLGAAVEYIEKIGWKEIQKREKWLNAYMALLLKEIKGVEVYGPNDLNNRLGVWSFNVKGVHAHDVGEILNRRQICVRVGHHCAQPLMNVLGQEATVRASLYIYNTKEDIDKLVAGIAEVKKVFKL
jgi:cysteine desulfurase / selenocysteine lyase